MHRPSALPSDASAWDSNTNLLERLFVEERRRLKIIPNAFGERAVLKLMFGALIRAAERWRSVKVTEFERRQMAAVRKELDEEYEAAVGLNIQQLSDLTVKFETTRYVNDKPSVRRAIEPFHCQRDQ